MQHLFSSLVKIYKALYLLSYDITGNYGSALILLSFFTFAVLYPFNKKAQQLQQKEHKIQDVLKPQIYAIKKQYNGREQYINLQWLYKRYGYHPLYAIRSALGILIQLPFLTAVYYMLSDFVGIQGVSWGIIPNLGAPDHLIANLNVLPFIMTIVTCVYAFVMPEISKKERMQTVLIGIFFLFLLYSAPSALLIFWICNLVLSLIDNILSNNLGWGRDFITQNELAFHIILALSLTVGLLVPIEIYIKNASEIWFSFKVVLRYLLIDSAKCFIILLLAYIVCWHKKIRGIYLSVLLGLLIAVFLQSYIISIDYGVFDGHEVEWERYSKIGLINTFIWLFCLITTFVYFKRLRFDTEIIKKYVKPFVFSIIAIQSIALLFTVRNYPLPENAFKTNKSISFFTTKNIFNISSKNNIIVLLLDMFDASIFEEIINKDSAIIKELQGFTFYPDTTSVYGLSYTSLPQLLTGKIYYNDMSRFQYLEKAWNNNQYYADLNKNNYDIGIYTIEEIASSNAPISNLVYENIVVNQEALSNLKAVILFRISPHYLKKVFYEYNPDFHLELLTKKNIQPYKENDREFFLQLKKGLSFQKEKNSFRFYHLRGAHYPYIFDRNMEYLEKGIKGNVYEQSVGAMKIVIEYIRQLKQNKVFNNCTFVIMADHGFHNKIGSRPLFCIKQPDSVPVDMKVSAKAISFSDFLPMLLQRFYGHNKNLESKDFSRKYYLQQERDFVEYEIVGNAKDIKSWKKKRVLGSWYKKQANLYTLGVEVDCSNKNWNFEAFQGTGWHEKPGLYGSWSAGPESTLIFNLSNYRKDKDLLFSFTGCTYLSDLPYRTAKFYVNDIFITDIILDNKKYDFSFKIPASLVDSSLLKVRFTIDHNGLSVRDGGAITDLGIFWQKLKIEKDNR